MGESAGAGPGGGVVSESEARAVGFSIEKIIMIRRERLESTVCESICNQESTQGMGIGDKRS